MSEEHLTDERVQEILDAQAPGDVLFLPWHAKTCRPCRERFREYQRLYSRLAVDPGFALPPGFADSVLARIPDPRVSLFRDPAICIGGAGVAALLLLALFIAWQPLAAGAVWTWNASQQLFAPLTTRLLGHFSGLAAAARPLLPGICGLLAAMLVERFLRRRLMRHGH
jgi:hypothetical protein